MEAANCELKVAFVVKSPPESAAATARDAGSRTVNAPRPNLLTKISSAYGRGKITWTILTETQAQLPDITEYSQSVLHAHNIAVKLP